jgi:hypothetical protein
LRPPGYHAARARLAAEWKKVGLMEDLDGLNEEELFRELPELGAVPADLYSDYGEGPFKSCTVCEADLLDGRTYQVQKAFQKRPEGGKECTFEMAVCYKCAQDLVKDYSEESKGAIRKFQQRSLQYNAADHCDFCPAPREQFGDYTVIGTCRGTGMISELIHMCERCCEDLQECLSEETRDIHGRFVKDNFPGVPENLDITPKVPSYL